MSSYSQMRDQVASSPVICMPLNVLGAILAVFGGIQVLILLVASATAATEPKVGDYAAPIAEISGGMVLLGLASVIRYVRVMRHIAEHQAEVENDRSKAAAAVAAADPLP